MAAASLFPGDRKYLEHLGFLLCSSSSISLAGEFTRPMDFFDGIAPA